jgi:hypothetical protein
MYARSPGESTPPEAAPDVAAPRLRAIGPAAVLALQRSAGNAAVTSKLARTPDIRIGDSSIEYSWSAVWTAKGAPASKQVFAQPGARKLDLPVQAGSEGILRLHVRAHVVKVPFGKWDLLSTCEWAVTIRRDGTLAAGAPAPTFVGADGSTIQPAGAPQVAADPDGRFTLSQSYVSGTDSGGGGLIITSGSTTAPVQAGESFVVALDVQGAAGPHVEISDVRAFVPSSHEVRFFHDGNTTVSSDQRGALMSWFAGLSKVTRRRLKAGTQKIRLEAFASDTGPADANQLKWSAGRLRAVREILGPDRFVADGAWIETSFGEDARPGEDLAPVDEQHEQSDPSRLIVRLEVEDEVTPGAGDDPFELIPAD